MDDLKEIVPYLDPGARRDLKIISLQYVLGLTGNTDGVRLIITCEEVLRGLAMLTEDTEMSADALFALVNISAEDYGTDAVMQLEISESSPALVEKLLKIILNENSKEADPACMLLCNLSRSENHLKHCANIAHPHLPRLMDAFTNVHYNKVGADLNYLGPLFSNLSGDGRVRAWLCTDVDGFKGAAKIVCFTQYLESVTRRGGAVGTLRNLCYDAELHDVLLGPEVNALTYILLPLAGGEEYPDDEMNSLPINLQYLPKDKQRETDLDIRKLLLESLNWLCSKKSSRQHMRDNGVYYILREYHKFEKDRRILLVCENVVDILIKKETEINIDDYSKVDVPEEYQEKFDKMDNDFISDA